MTVTAPPTRLIPASSAPRSSGDRVRARAGTSSAHTTSAPRTRPARPMRRVAQPPHRAPTAPPAPLIAAITPTVAGESPSSYRTKAGSRASAWKITLLPEMSSVIRRRKRRRHSQRSPSAISGPSLRRSAARPAAERRPDAQDCEQRQQVRDAPEQERRPPGGGERGAAERLSEQARGPSPGLVPGERRGELRQPARPGGRRPVRRGGGRPSAIPRRTRPPPGGPDGPGPPRPPRPRSPWTRRSPRCTRASCDAGSTGRRAHLRATARSGAGVAPRRRPSPPPPPIRWTRSAAAGRRPRWRGSRAG